MTRPPAHRPAATLALAGAACAVLPAGAHAGSYVIHSWRVPGQPVSAIAGWTARPASGDGGQFFNSCAGGGDFGVGLPAGNALAPNSINAVAFGVGQTGIAVRQLKLYMVTDTNGTGSTAFAALRAVNDAGTITQTDLFGRGRFDNTATPVTSPAYPPDMREVSSYSSARRTRPRAAR